MDEKVLQMPFLIFKNTLKKSKNMENYKQERAFQVSDQINVGPSFLHILNCHGFSLEIIHFTAMKNTR